MIILPAALLLRRGGIFLQQFMELKFCKQRAKRVSVWLIQAQVSQADVELKIVEQIRQFARQTGLIAEFAQILLALPLT